MTRVISFLTAAAIAVSLVTAAAAEGKENIITMRIGDPRITINGKAQSIDSEGTVPVIRNDRTLLPVRAFVEGIGGKAEWDENARTATLSYGGDEIKLTIDSEKAYLNNELKTLDTKPVIINNRTMLPIRFIAESFGYTVAWDQPTETVTVTGMAMTDTIAATEAGLVRGSLSDGIYEYLGVPYAEAKELFVKADKVTPWEGVRDATEYGDTSIQGALFGAAAAGAAEGTSNSCQNLNIWTPSINDGGKRAVMVWLHGGGFSTGSANEGSVDGENLSRSGDVVVVGVNHRLNLFGHLDLSALRKPMLKIMSHKADQNGAKVYAYVFTKQIGDQGSYHTAEIPFVFNNTDDALAKTMSEAWANFAKTGVPSAKGLSEWEPYTREGMATMILDDESYLAHDHDKRLIEMLEPDYEY